MATEPQTLNDLKNLWSGETVWVVGSGPSLETTPPELYDDKRVVSINMSAFYYGIKQFIIASNYSRHNEVMQKMCDDHPEHLMVTPDCDISVAGNQPTHPTLGNNLTFRPRWPVWNPTEGWPTDPDSLVVAGNSSGVAMHLAAYMGCAEMRLIGVDMAIIGGRSSYAGYVNYGVPPAFDGALQQLRIVANRLRTDYRCDIVRFVGSQWEPVE
jgi:hypothetical protein